MKNSILYIDDEKENLESFRMAFWKEYDIELAESTADAEKILSNKEIQLVISDQRMAKETGLEFIKRIKPFFPSTIFIILTAYSEMELVISAINTGIDRFIQKPWSYNELKLAIDSAMEKYQLRKKNSELLVSLKNKNEKLNQFNSQLIANSDELKLSQKEILKREKLLAAIFKNLPLVVLIIDIENRIRTINHTGRLLAGKSENEILGKRFGEAFHCVTFVNEQDNISNCANCIIKQTVQTTFANKLENYQVEGNIALQLNGKEKKSIVSISATYLEQENPIVLLSINEITKLKESEKKLHVQNQRLENLNQNLQQAILKSQESDRLKSGIIANISHEIRTPMNAIIGFAEMLLKPSIPEDKREVYTNIIKESGYRLLRVVNDIVDISKITTDRLEIFNEEVCINHIISEMHLLFVKQANKKNLKLSSIKPLTDRESTISSDRLRLIQILNNLLENAIKFSEEGQIEIGYQLKNDFIEFFVSDTGIGIPENLSEKIFDDFYQIEMNNNRKFAGIGIGLSISKKLVELMGGKIWMNSSPGKGTTFYFTIPYKTLG